MITRKPADKLNGYDTREAVWQAIRRLKRFTIPELHMETTMTVDSVRDYCIGLSKAGYIERVGEVKPAKTTAAVWKLTRDVGVIAPRVRKNGTLVVQGLGREQMWRTMRILGKFCIRRLVVSASTEECVIKDVSARDYCIMLCHAGYLRRTAPGCYLFLQSRYTGPRPPMIQRTKQVYDPNLGRVMWRTGDKEAANGK